MAFKQTMSVWFGNRTRAKVLKYEDYPLWVPFVQFPFAALLTLVGLGLTPGASGQMLIAASGMLWLVRIGWCFYRIVQTILIKRRLRPTL